MSVGGDSPSEGISSTSYEEEDSIDFSDHRITPSFEQQTESGVDFDNNPYKNHLSRRRSEFITIGSTKEDVARIQGTPTRINDFGYIGSWWSYGNSKIEFDGKGRIEGWDNSDRNLRVRM